MDEDYLLKAVEDGLKEIVFALEEGRIDEEDTLKILNKAVHYKHQFYIYEMFFIEALRLGKVPRAKYLLCWLFEGLTEDFMFPDQVCWIDGKISVSSDGIRFKVLDALGLEKTKKKYIEFLGFNEADIPKDIITIDLHIFDVKEVLLEELRCVE